MLWNRPLAHVGSYSHSFGAQSRAASCHSQSVTPPLTLPSCSPRKAGSQSHQPPKSPLNEKPSTPTTLGFGPQVFLESQAPGLGQRREGSHRFPRLLENSGVRGVQGNRASVRRGWPQGCGHRIRFSRIQLGFRSKTKGPQCSASLGSVLMEIFTKFTEQQAEEANAGFPTTICVADFLYSDDPTAFLTVRHCPLWEAEGLPDVDSEVCQEEFPSSSLLSLGLCPSHPHTARSCSDPQVSSHTGYMVEFQSHPQPKLAPLEGLARQ